MSTYTSKSVSIIIIINPSATKKKHKKNATLIDKYFKKSYLNKKTLEFYTNVLALTQNCQI